MNKTLIRRITLFRERIEHALLAKRREERVQEGRAQGWVISVLQVLDRRGIAIDDGSRDRIESCTDADMLSTWLDRALTATKAADLFD